MQNSKMAGNNPRKFSEKIALHLQKQAEEKAAFEEIMKEVSGVASKVCDGPVRDYFTFMFLYLLKIYWYKYN